MESLPNLLERLGPYSIDYGNLLPHPNERPSKERLGITSKPSRSSFTYSARISRASHTPRPRHQAQPRLLRTLSQLSDQIPTRRPYSDLRIHSITRTNSPTPTNRFQNYLPRVQSNPIQSLDAHPKPPSQRRPAVPPLPPNAHSARRESKGSTSTPSA